MDIVVHCVIVPLWLISKRIQKKPCTFSMQGNSQKHAMNYSAGILLDTGLHPLKINLRTCIVHYKE